MDIHKISVSTLYDVIGDENKAQAVYRMLIEKEKEEKELQKSKQKQGFERAREQGIALGRPKLLIPRNFQKLYTRFRNKEISASEAASRCKMSTRTFYRVVKEYEENQEKTIKAL